MLSMNSTFVFLFGDLGHCCDEDATSDGITTRCSGSGRVSVWIWRKGISPVSQLGDQSLWLVVLTNLTCVQVGKSLHVTKDILKLEHIWHEQISSFKNLLFCVLFSTQQILMLTQLACFTKVPLLFLMINFRHWLLGLLLSGMDFNVNILFKRLYVSSRVCSVSSVLPAPKPIWKY